MSKIACLQFTATADRDENLETATHWITQAAKAGAEMIILPEMFAYMGKHEQDKREIAERLGQGPIQTCLQNLASTLNVWLVAGTIPLVANQEQVQAACLVYDKAGGMVAHYNKIHLFDVTLPDQTGYCESNHTQAGTHATVIDTPFGRLGLAVCYDLRFPHLFNALVDAGVELIAIPAAFTKATGELHWQVLNQCRALDTLSYIFAANQTGQHDNGKWSYGHSLAVSPWGEIIAEMDEESGFLIVEYDKSYIHTVRAQFPVLSHRREVKVTPS